MLECVYLKIIASQMMRVRSVIGYFQFPAFVYNDVYGVECIQVDESMNLTNKDFSSHDSGMKIKEHVQTHEGHNILRSLLYHTPTHTG